MEKLIIRQRFFKAFLTILASSFVGLNASESPKTETKKVEEAKTEPKVEEVKKAEPKKEEAKKGEEVKKAEPKVVEMKKVEEVKKPEPKVVETKKVEEVKKPEPKVVETKKVEAKQEKKSDKSHDFLNDGQNAQVKNPSCDEKHEKMIKNLEANNKKLTDRLEALEQKILTEKKSDYENYGRIGDSKVNVNFSGNLNMFSAYYPNQKPNETGIVTDPRYVLFNAQEDSNGNAPALNKKKFAFSGNGSTLSTKIKTPTDKGDFFVQFDIGASMNAESDATRSSTTSASLYVSDAHIEYMNFTVGYTYSNFSDPNSLGSWLNVGGIQESNLAYYPLSVQYTYEMSKEVAIRLSIESPIQDGLEQNATSVVLSSNGKTTEPALVAQITYKKDDAAFSLRLMERKLQQKGDGFDLSGRGYGVGLSGKYNVAGKSNLYFQTAYGKGIGSYIGELTNYGFLCDLTDVNNRRFELLKAYSFLIGTQVYVSDNVYFNLAYQQNGVKYPSFASRSGTINTGANSAGSTIANLATKDQKVMANIIYEVNDHFKLGLEGVYVKRNLLAALNNQRSANATILMFGMKFTF
ncbi:MAG: porin [Proteobacteria bacterium]|nr:porin [Pseudomonadota bacterium]